MIQLIGIDVDGTLLDPRGQVPQANADAIAEAVAAGIHVALVTGRSYTVTTTALGQPPTWTLRVVTRP